MRRDDLPAEARAFANPDRNGDLSRARPLPDALR